MSYSKPRLERMAAIKNTRFKKNFFKGQLLLLNMDSSQTNKGKDEFSAATIGSLVSYITQK